MAMLLSGALDPVAQGLDVRANCVTEERLLNLERTIPDRI